MKLQNNELHLLDYWRVLLRRRYVAMAFFAGVVGIVAIYSFVVTPVYKSTALVLLKLENNPAVTFSEANIPAAQKRDSAEYYNTQIEIIKSRVFADKVVRKLQLDKNAYFLDKKSRMYNGLLHSKSNFFKGIVAGLFHDKNKSPDQFPDIAFQQELDPDITDIILDNMEVEIGKESNILSIEYYSERPIVAAFMANGIANTYIEHNLNIRVKPFKDAVEWLSDRMVELRSRVEGSEKALQKYKEEKGVESFEIRESVIALKLEELVSQLIKAEGRRQEAEIKYNQINSVIDNPELLTTVPDIMNNIVIQGLRNDELRIKKELSELSEKYGPKHPQMIKVKSELTTVQDNLVDEARKMLNAAKMEYDVAVNRELSLRKAVEDQKQEVLNLGRTSIEFNVIAGGAESNKLFYEVLLKRLQEASLSSGMDIPNAQVVDLAVVPKSPVKPRKGFNVLMAIIGGTFGGLFLALFAEYMDNTLKTPEDVDKILNLPFLGIVPSAESIYGENEKGPLYLLSEPNSIISESYRTIRTSIMLSFIDKPLKVLQITSVAPKEGKSTIAANLAIAMAQMGEKVLLIDADLRQHKIDKIFKIDNSIGISNVIMGDTYLSAAIKTIPDISNLYIITAGGQVTNPSELLGSDRMKELLVEVRESYNHIILDSPPVMAVSDPLVLSGFTDGIVLVVWGGVTGRDIVEKAKQSLAGVNAKILGVVLNNVTVTKENSYQYYYPYYYSYVGDEDRNGKG